MYIQQRTTRGSFTIIIIIIIGLWVWQIFQYVSKPKNLHTEFHFPNIHLFSQIHI